MIGLWLHEMGGRVVAFPFRIVIGLVFINQGLQNMGAFGSDASVAGGKLLDVSQYGFSGAPETIIGIALILAGALAMVGMFVRIVGGVLFFVVITNLFAGLGDVGGMQASIQLIQNRLLLAVCALVLFFLGSGILSLDGLIFRAIGRGMDGDDNDDKKK